MARTYEHISIKTHAAHTVKIHAIKLFLFDYAIEENLKQKRNWQRKPAKKCFREIPFSLFFSNCHLDDWCKHTNNRMKVLNLFRGQIALIHRSVESLLLAIGTIVEIGVPNSVEPHDIQQTSFSIVWCAGFHRRNFAVSKIMRLSYSAHFRRMVTKTRCVFSRKF